MARVAKIVSAGLRVGSVPPLLGADEKRATLHEGQHRLTLTRGCVADADDRLRYLAALEPAIHEFSADDHPDQIRAAATHIRANVVAAARVLLDLAVFTGRLEGLAWWGSGPGGVG